jgi:hypothetical protein
MSDDKRPSDKSDESDETKEPIDFSVLLNSDEEDDDVIIELTDEVTSPQPTGEKEIDEEALDRDEDEDDDVIPLTQEIDSQEDTDEERIALRRDPDWDDALLEDDETEETEVDLFALTDDMTIESGESADIADSRQGAAGGDDADEALFELSDDLDVVTAGEEQLLQPIDEPGLDFDQDDSDVTLTDEAEIEAPDSDIIEIDEFDEHFPDGNFDMVDALIAEDDTDLEEDEFLELIEIEEETIDDEDEEENGAVIDLAAAEEVQEEVDEADDELNDGFIDFEAEKDEMKDSEIENFFSEPFDEKEDEIEFDEIIEDEVAESFGLDVDSDMDMSPEEPEVAESVDRELGSDMDMTPEESEVVKSLGMNLEPDLEMDGRDDEDGEPLKMDFGTSVDMPEEEPEVETTDFKVDTDIISDKKEDLETIQFDNSVAEEPAEEVDEDIPQIDEAEADETETIDLGTITSRQIEDAVERLIQDNYSEKIESIIVSVIEKAVSREIQKLKDTLLDDISDIETS